MEADTPWLKKVVDGKLVDDDDKLIVIAEEALKNEQEQLIGERIAKNDRATAIEELKNERNRSIALWAMGNCNITQSVTYAKKYLFNCSQEMQRVRSAGIIRKTGSTNEVNLLINVLKSKDSWNVKCAAAKALQNKGKKTKVETFEL